MPKHDYFGLNFKILDPINTHLSHKIQKSESKIWQIPRFSRTIRHSLEKHLQRIHHSQMLTLDMDIEGVITNDTYPLSYYIKLLNLLNTELLKLYKHPKQTDLSKLPLKIRLLNAQYPYRPTSLADSAMRSSRNLKFTQRCLHNTLSVKQFEVYMTKFDFRPFMSSAIYGCCNVLTDNVFTLDHVFDHLNEFINMHLQKNSPGNWAIHGSFPDTLRKFQQESPYDMTHYRPLIARHLFHSYRISRAYLKTGSIK